MALWGKAHASATNKPKYLPESEDSKYSKADCYATQAGWVMQPGAATGNSRTTAQPEVLIAIRGLAGTSATTGLKTPTVTDMRFVVGTTATTDLTVSSSATLEVEITWDEGVTVATSNPTVIIANGNQSSAGNGNYVLVYTAAGSTANRKRFVLASQTLSATDILTIGGANIVLASSSTISDTVVGGTTVAASLVLSGLTAVTHTVLA